MTLIVIIVLSILNIIGFSMLGKASENNNIVQAIQGSTLVFFATSLLIARFFYFK